MIKRRFCSSVKEEEEEEGGWMGGWEEENEERDGKADDDPFIESEKPKKRRRRCWRPAHGVADARHRSPSATSTRPFTFTSLPPSHLLFQTATPTWNKERNENETTNKRRHGRGQSGGWGGGGRVFNLKRQNIFRTEYNKIPKEQEQREQRKSIGERLIALLTKRSIHQLTSMITQSVNCNWWPTGAGIPPADGIDSKQSNDGSPSALIRNSFDWSAETIVRECVSVDIVIGVLTGLDESVTTLIASAFRRC